MIDSVRPSIRLSVSLSVRHTLVSCRNDSSYDHAVLLEDSPNDPSFLVLNFTAKFRRVHRETGRGMREG